MNRKLVVVEREFAEPLSLEQITQIKSGAQSCLDLYDVRYLRGYLSADGLRMICTYEARDAESVRQANRQAQVPFVKAWTADLVEDPDDVQAP